MSRLKLLRSRLCLNILCFTLLITVQSNTIDNQTPQQEDVLSNICGFWLNSTCFRFGANIYPTYTNGTLNVDSLLMDYYGTVLTKSPQGSTWTGNFTEINDSEPTLVTIDMSSDQATFTMANSSSSCSLAHQVNQGLISGTWVRDSNINSTLPEIYEITVVNNAYMIVNADFNVSSYLGSPGAVFCPNGTCSQFSCSCPYYDSRLQISFAYSPGMQMFEPGTGASILYYPQNRSTYQLIFPVGTWGNVQNIAPSYNCCTPNSIEISANTEPATKNELIVEYRFTSESATSPACAPISKYMVNNVLTTNLTYQSGNDNWLDPNLFFGIIDNYYDSSDEFNLVGNGTIITGAYANYWSSFGSQAAECFFSMTLQDGPNPKPNSEQRLASWKFINIIYGVFICFVILN